MPRGACWIASVAISRTLPEEVRQYFIPDFSNWKNHDDFERAFDRLLRDLTAEERTVQPG
jgi:hypothetical protein